MDHTNTNHESGLLSNFFTLSKQQLDVVDKISITSLQRYLLTPRDNIIDTSEFSTDIVECTCPTNSLIDYGA